MTARASTSQRHERPLPLVGAQISAAGGWGEVPARVRTHGAEVVQLFSSNPRIWPTGSLDVDGLATLSATLEEQGVPLFFHTAYLINLASPDPALRARSASAVAHAVVTGALSGAQGIVTHVGSHRGEGFAKAVPWVIASLHDAQAEVERHLASRTLALPRLLLETSAGSGATVGTTLEELATLVDTFGRSPAGDEDFRLGLCLDSAHMFAAGYPLHRPEGLRALRHELEQRDLVRLLGLIHLNDSASPFASNRDRHANPGEGELGQAALTRIVRDPILRRVPFVLEVPGEERQGPTALEIGLVQAMREKTAVRRSSPARPGKGRPDPA